MIAMLGLLLCLTFCLAPPVQAEPWLHVRVVEHGHDGETVRVNLPVSLVESLIPVLEEHGNVHRTYLEFEDHDLDIAELRQILTALRDAKDGQYITVESDDEHVRVEKTGEMLLVQVQDNDDDQQIHIRLRMEVLDALLSGGDKELNIRAALNALQSGEELVTVEGEDESVRIWVDESNESD